IVTPIPGTTRDMVTGDIVLGGSVIHLTDTAGLHATADPVEQLGVARARRAMDEADLVLSVFDASRPLSDDDRALLSALRGKNTLLLLNKADLPPRLTAADLTALLDAPVLAVSAANEDTLQPLKAYLAEQAAVSDKLALTQPRHIEAARRAAQHLRHAAETARTLSVDMASLDLQAAQQSLAEITGDEVEERLLDRVFNMFCVGK
ncbi:MAG: 50S ribosome-binding GTPase, partial [Clostridiales bacterium]|nr:50S ribosome-binding GTPase [Clostridiales bacterium]